MKSKPANTRARQPLVSVLVTAYNHEDYVLECLESIRQSSYKRLELILSDDCSHDDTFVLAEKWAHTNSRRFERIHIVRQDKNIGLIKNLHFLFDESQGEFLALVSADDALIPSGIHARADVLMQNPQLDAVFGDWQLISADGAVLDDGYIPQPVAVKYSKLWRTPLFASFFLLNCFMAGPILMLRKQATSTQGALGRLPETLVAEDRYIYIRLAMRGKLGFVNETVAKYRVVPGSLSRPLSQYRFNLWHIIQADQMNNVGASGFNRFVLENRLNRNILEWNKHEASFYRARVLWSRSIYLFLRLLLFFYALCVGVASCCSSGRTTGHTNTVLE